MTLEELIFMKKYLASFGSILPLLFCGNVAGAATIVHIGTLPPATAYFFVTGETAGDRFVTANFGDTFSGVTSFDDQFQFTLPLDGTGSGSVSTSFSSPQTQIIITNVIINGVSYSAEAAAMGITGIPVTGNVLNTIEVIGQTTSGNVIATLSGTATFSASVPEPASWAMMLVGMGAIGFAARRRRAVSVTYA
jgi:hypothetical protein